MTNLIETNDGGYAFLTVGYAHQGYLHPAIFFKVNSTGNIQWTKPMEHFTATAIIQTSDGRYEISGNWRTPTPYDLKPTLIKTDRNGTIEWNRNYTTNPPELQPYTAVPQNGSITSTLVCTSDGGYAYVNQTGGSIVKTNQNNQTQWVKSVNYSEQKTILLEKGSFTVPAIPLVICSLIETSDGALAGLGISLNQGDNTYNCAICLVKTEPFLPIPTPTSPPAPIQQFEETGSNYDSVIQKIVIIAVIAIIVLIIFGLYRNRKQTPTGE